MEYLIKKGVQLYTKNGLQRFNAQLAKHLVACNHKTDLYDSSVTKARHSYIFSNSPQSTL